MNLELKFIKTYKSYNCPVAMLKDVIIIFNHYNSENEAKESWERRKQRVNYDNLFIIFDDIADAEYSDLLDFLKIKCKGKMILTAANYSNMYNTTQLTKYKDMERMPAYLLDKSIWTRKNAADYDFDFVSWLNGESRKNER